MSETEPRLLVSTTGQELDRRILPSRDRVGAPLQNVAAPSERTTASALHQFNRYEIKYLIPQDRLPSLRAFLEARMGRDPHQSTPTRITSLYYDTRSLRFYWEKIEGVRFRRKLRIRMYGPPESIDEDTTAFVEIKQRVNRVTQKRRISLPYRDARVLCDGREEPLGHGRPGFVGEVLTLCRTLDLHPTAITTYFRDGYIGRESDLGLRVTLDHRISGRDRDFYLGARATNHFIIPPEFAVVEVKANDRVPTWFTDVSAEMNLTPVRISKYCKAVEAHELGGRASQHRRDLPVPGTAK